MRDGVGQVCRPLTMSESVLSSRCNNSKLSLDRDELMGGLFQSGCAEVVGRAVCTGQIQGKPSINLWGRQRRREEREGECVHVRR